MPISGTNVSAGLSAEETDRIKDQSIESLLAEHLLDDCVPDEAGAWNIFYVDNYAKISVMSDEALAMLRKAFAAGFSSAFTEL